MKYLFLALAISISFLSCKKNKGLSYTIEGTLTDQSFSTSAPGVTVELFSTPLAGEEFLAQTAVTGSDGKYSFTINRDKTEGFRLVFTKDNYFTETTSFTMDGLNAKEPNIFNMSITAKAWARLIFTNADPGESITVIKTAGLSNCTECCTFSSFTLSGVTDTSFVCINRANDVYSYQWFYQGTTTQNENQIVTVPLDTTDFILNF